MARPKKTTGRSGRRKSGAVAALGRLEKDLPPTLRQFSQQVRKALTRLEGEIVQARRIARGEGTRLLRDASHALGRYEAFGERQWRRLTTPARREAVKLLRRLEKAIAVPPKKKRPTARPRLTAPAPSPAPEPSHAPLAPGM